MKKRNASKHRASVGTDGDRARNNCLHPLLRSTIAFLIAIVYLVTVRSLPEDQNKFQILMLLVEYFLDQALEYVCYHVRAFFEKFNRLDVRFPYDRIVCTIPYMMEPKIEPYLQLNLYPKLSPTQNLLISKGYSTRYVTVIYGIDPEDYSLDFGVLLKVEIIILRPDKTKFNITKYRN